MKALVIVVSGVNDSVAKIHVASFDLFVGEIGIWWNLRKALECVPAEYVFDGSDLVLEF